VADLSHLAVGAGSSTSRRVGAGRGRDAEAESPFDFEHQLCSTSAQTCQNPTRRFRRACDRGVARLIELSHVAPRALHFPSPTLNAVAERLAGTWPIRVRPGEAAQPALLELFRHSSAVAGETASFWQGVDVVGEQLSCVIIDKCPLPPPRIRSWPRAIEHLTRQAGTPFCPSIRCRKRCLRSTRARAVDPVRRATVGVLACRHRLVERPYADAPGEPAAGGLVHDLEQARAVLSESQFTHGSQVACTCGLIARRPVKVRKRPGSSRAAPR